MKDESRSAAAGMGALMLFLAMAFAVVWMFGVDRAGVIAAVSLAAGIVISVAALFASTRNRQKN